MVKPFMIRIPYKGKGCYANVYTHDNSLKEFHVHIIEPDAYPEIPRKIIFRSVNDDLQLSEPQDLSAPILHQIVREIQTKAV